MEDYFTEQEKKVLEVAALGYTDKRISEIIGTSIKAVNRTLERVYLRLGVSRSDGWNPGCRLIRLYEDSKKKK